MTMECTARVTCLHQGDCLSLQTEFVHSLFKMRPIYLGFRDIISFLAYPTGISVNPTGARKCRRTRGGVRRLSDMTSGCIFDVLLSILTSLSCHLF